MFKWNPDFTNAVQKLFDRSEETLRAVNRGTKTPFTQVPEEAGVWTRRMRNVRWLQLRRTAGIDRERIRMRMRTIASMT